LRATLLGCGDERVMQSLFGGVQAAEQAHERGKDATAVPAVNVLNGGDHLSTPAEIA